MKQPEALRLADHLESRGLLEEAAELRRQHALILEMREALELLDNYVSNNLENSYPTGVDINSPEFSKARAVIEKASNE